MCVHSTLTRGPQDAGTKLSDEVTRREVVTDDVDTATSVGESSSDSDLAAALPDDLSEVSAWFSTCFVK